MLALLLVQIVMVSSGLTTLEFLKGYWKGMVNPFDNGCATNCITCCFKVDRSSHSINHEQIKLLNKVEIELESGDRKSQTSDTKTRASLKDNLIEI